MSILTPETCVTDDLCPPCDFLLRHIASRIVSDSRPAPPVAIGCCYAGRWHPGGAFWHRVRGVGPPLTLTKLSRLTANGHQSLIHRS